jgi:hypothetical protein
MSLRNEILDYVDADGLVSPRRVEDKTARSASGNGLLYTSEYMIALHLRGDLNLTDIEGFVRVLRSCQKEPGLFNRSPIHKDQNAPDDYTGILAACHMIGIEEFPRAIYKYGNEHGWVFDNTGEGSKSAWFWRMPHLVAAIKIAAGEKCELWRQIYTTAVILWAIRAKREDQDAHTLTWLLTKITDDKWIPRQAGKLWRWKFKRQYPRGLGQVLSDYFNCYHPLANYFPPEP